MLPSASPDCSVVTHHNNNNNNLLIESTINKSVPKWQPQVKAKDLDSGRWVRPLSIMESYWAKITKYSCANTVQALWLSSAQPIQPGIVTKAVHHVTSKLELLQMCIRQRRSRLWFRHMNSSQFDFTISCEEPMAIYDTLLHTRFNLKEGPLWKGYISINARSPNEAVLLLSIHHTITDGSTNVIILRDILDAVNAAYRNEEFQTEFKSVPPPLMDDLLSMRRHLPYALKEAIKGHFIALVLDRVKWNPFRVIRGYPGPIVTKVRVIAREMSVATTKKLIQRCKESRITVNSCFVAAARLAMFKLVQVYKPDCQELKMAVENLVNMRRYLPAEHAETMGCFISSEGQRFTVNEQDFQDFLQLATKVNEKQSEHLETQIPFKRLIVYCVLCTADIINKWLSKKGYRNIEACQLGITNMGNLEKYLPSHIETHVQATNYVRSVSIQNGPSTCLLSCHTLRGKLLISLDYSTNKLTDEMAQLLTDNLLSILQSWAENGRTSS